MPEYQPVPVEAARQVAQQYAKAQVVIVSWDAAHALVHTTTYGVSPDDKVQAARLSDLIAERIGFDLEKARGFEDFRAVEKGEWAAQKEALVAVLREFEAAMGGVPNTGNSRDDDLTRLSWLGHIRKKAQAALAKAGL